MPQPFYGGGIKIWNLHMTRVTQKGPVQRVRIMFGVFSIVPNTNIDGNDLHDCVK